MSKIKMCDDGAIQLMEGIMKKAHDDYIMLYQKKITKPNGDDYVVGCSQPGLRGTVKTNLDMIEDYIHYMFPDTYNKIILSLREEAQEKVDETAKSKSYKKRKIS